MAFNISNSESIKKLVISAIGFIVVVVLTLIVYNDIQEGVFKVLYRQAYAKANYAWQSTVMSNGIGFTFSVDEHVKNFKIFRENSHPIVKCDANNFNECWSEGERFFGTYPNKVSLSFIDDKGMSWTNACSFKCAGEILVDVNALEPPNKYGKDRFVFYPAATGAGYHLNKPMNLSAPEDYKYQNEYFCPSGNCLYQSWLY